MSEISTIHRARRSGGGPDERALAGDLSDAIGQLRRSIRRNVRRGWPHRPLAENELELVRLLRERPGIRVRDAAAALGLADNTVSTLVGRLSGQGWVDRNTDPRDARAARLVLSEAARRRAADWRDRRAQLVGSALGELSAAERDALVAAVPALRSLREIVEAGS